MTPSARRALTLAQESARGFGQAYWGTEHLLIGLAAADSGVACSVLTGLGYSAERFQREIAFLIGNGEEPADSPRATPRIERVLDAAVAECARRGETVVSTLHLLASLVKEKQGVAVMLLELPGTGLERLAGRMDQAHREGLRDS